MANQSYDEPINVEVEMENNKGGLLMASPEVPEAKESNGKVEIPALSATVFIEE